LAASAPLLMAFRKSVFQIHGAALALDAQTRQFMGGD
jgi:hypothetical protein